MKRSTLLCLLGMALSITLLAQTPESMNYQAIARNASGEVLSSASLSVRIAILQGEELLWQEDHSLTTSEAGFFSLSIGDPDASPSGGSLGSFSDIDWAGGNTSLEVSVDDGSGYVSLGVTPFKAVPYALYAAESPGATPQELSLQGNQLSISEGNSVDLTGIGGGSGSLWGLDSDTLTTMKHVGIGTSEPMQSTLAVQGYNIHPEVPLFEVRREDGFPVFAVYNDGVRVYVDEETKGVRGGFAVGGYSRSTKGVEQEYLMVSPDSVRIYVPEEEALKGVRGGFAVGGYSRTKGVSQTYLTVSPDSTRVYVPEDDIQTKGVRGGFAVGGYSRTKGYSQEYLRVTPDSTRVYVPNKENDNPDFEGLQGGFAVSGINAESKGAAEYLMGINRGITRFNTNDSDRGFAIGSQEDGWGGSYLELTPTNSFIGSDAGLHNKEIDPNGESDLSSMNVFVGYQSGMFNEYGHHNTFLGFCAGTNTVGDNTDPEMAAHNTFLGTQSGFNNIQGSYNAYLGCYTGFENTHGNYNVFIGGNAGFSGVDASRATMVGNNSGAWYNGPGNVTYLGFYSGFTAQGENNTFIGFNAGAYASQGSYNVSLGHQSAQNLDGDNNTAVGHNAGLGVYGESDGSDNSLFGHSAGAYLTTGSANTFLGSQSGLSNATGSGNVFLGYEAGYYEEGSDQLYLDNSSTVDPLLWGSFDYDYLIVYGDLDVQGTLYESSDASLKTNINPLSGTLEKLKAVRGVSFQWKEGSSQGSKGSGDVKGGPKRTGQLDTPETSIGVLAQDVEQVFPELVATSRNGEKAVNYSGLIPVLIEAVKEQQLQIEAQQEVIRSLEQRLSELEQ